MFRELKVLVYAVRLLKDHDLGKLLKIQCWRAWSLRWEIFFMTFSVFNLNCNVFLTLSPPNCDAWCKLQSQVLKSCSLYVYPFRYLGSKRLHYTFFLDCEKKTFKQAANMASPYSICLDHFMFAAWQFFFQLQHVTYAAVSFIFTTPDPYEISVILQHDIMQSAHCHNTIAIVNHF